MDWCVKRGMSPGLSVQTPVPAHSRSHNQERPKQQVIPPAVPKEPQPTLATTVFGRYSLVQPAVAPAQASQRITARSLPLSVAPPPARVLPGTPVRVVTRVVMGCGRKVVTVVAGEVVRRRVEVLVQLALRL